MKRLTLVIVMLLLVGTFGVPHDAIAQTPPYPYPSVAISATPQVVREEGPVRISWSSVWGSPYNTWSPDAYRGETYGCSLRIQTESGFGGTDWQTIQGSGSNEFFVYEETTFTIMCAGEVERGKCADHISARADNGPDSVCRSMEKMNDDVKDGRPQGPSTAGKYHNHYASATVTVDYPEDPLIATCSVSPATAEVNTPVTWSATAEGGKAVYSTDRWNIIGEKCAFAQGLPICDGTVSYGATCPVRGEKCIQLMASLGCEPDESPIITDNPPIGGGEQRSGNPNYMAQVHRCEPRFAYGSNHSFSWSGTDDLMGTAAQVVKTYLTPGIKSGTATISAAGGQAIRTCQMTVGAVAEGVDLTAGSVRPTTAVAGTATILSATASNQGTTASASFPILFQIESPARLIESSYLSGLGAGTSGDGSVSHTFAAAGSYQVRACANYTSSWATVVMESDYTNNCGPWTTITVAEAPPSGTLACSVSSSAIEVGESVTYQASGAGSPYTWTAADGGSFGSSDTVIRVFNTAGSYGMSVAKSGYVSGNCPVVVVGPSGGACTSPTAQVTAAPNRVRPGTTTTLSYSASGITTSCVISGPGVNQTLVANTCVVPGGNVTTPPLSTQATYTIVCDGVELDREVINVLPNFEEF